MVRIAVIAAVAVVVGGCATKPTQADLAQADFGDFPNDYETIVKSYYGEVLKDPGSVQYRNITHPKVYATWGMGGPTRYGYLVCVTLNAKNSYGGYTGFQTDGILIRNDRVIQTMEKGTLYATRVC